MVAVKICLCHEQPRCQPVGKIKNRLTLNQLVKSGAGLHKLIKGEPVLDFADGLATRLFMAKANFDRDHQGQMILIRQMDFLTIPEAEIQDLLRAGLVKADRDLRTLH